MGSINSHEPTRSSLGPTRATNNQYESAANPSATHSLAKQTHSGCSAPGVRMGKIKLNDLASGDAATCCTTSCGSSLSGSSASPDVGTRRATRDRTTGQQITITLCSDSCWERSLSARAVSSFEDQSPRGFNPETAFPALEAEGKTAAKKSRWHHRSPRVTEMLATLRERAVRCRSQPPSSNACEGTSDCHGEASPSSRCSPASALRAHILMAEDEHRRRRHSDMGGHSSSASVTHIERSPPVGPELSLAKLPGNRPLLVPIQKTADTSSDCQVLCTAASPPPNLRNAAEQAEPQKMPLTVTAYSRTAGGRLAPPPSHQQAALASSWIADAPPDGRWEVERGVWTRQGVHINHLRTADERFKALAATRLGTPSRHCPPQPRVIPAAPLAGRMAKQQQMLLQRGVHHAAPITNRGVAAATTIEIAKRRQVTEERRRHQQRHIAPSKGYHQDVAASNNSEQKAPVTLYSEGEDNSRPKERFEGRIATGRVEANGRGSVCHWNGSVKDVAIASSGVRIHAGRPIGRSDNECQLAEEPNAAVAADFVSRGQKALQGCQELPVCPGEKCTNTSSRCSGDKAEVHDETTTEDSKALTFTSFFLTRSSRTPEGDNGQNSSTLHLCASRAAQHEHLLSVHNGTEDVSPSPGKEPPKIVQRHGFPLSPDTSQRAPSASRAQQKNAFVANPRANMGARKR